MSYRPAPRGLHVQTPLCPMCGTRVTFDSDNYSCRPCGAYWSVEDPEEEGQWHDEDEAQCTSTVDASKSGGGTYRCVKSESHVDGATEAERNHHGPERSTWPNSWLPEIRPARDTAGAR
jgi:hypothetical protein